MLLTHFTITDSAPKDRLLHLYSVKKPVYAQHLQSHVGTDRKRLRGCWGDAAHSLSRSLTRTGGTAGAETGPEKERGHTRGTAP